MDTGEDITVITIHGTVITVILITDTVAIMEAMAVTMVMDILHFIHTVTKRVTKVNAAQEDQIQLIVVQV